MSKNSMYLLGIILITIGLSALLTRKGGEKFNQVIDAGNSVSLNVTTSSGDIDISNSNSSELRIDTDVKVRSFIPFEAGRITKRIKNNPPIEQNGNQVTIGDMSKYRFGPSLFRSISIDYDIETPFETEVELRSSSGNQTVKDIAGPITTKVSSGDIKLNDILKDINAVLSSGNLTVDEAEGSLNITLSSGDIKLSDITGNITTKQSSGNTSLKDVSGKLNISTSSGNITLDSDLVNNTDWTLKTSSGNVVLALPNDTDSNVDINVTSGNIDFGSFNFTGEESNRKAIGTIGKATSSNDLKIDTTSGDVRFN